MALTIHDHRAALDTASSTDGSEDDEIEFVMNCEWAKGVELLVGDDAVFGNEMDPFLVSSISALLPAFRMPTPSPVSPSLKRTERVLTMQRIERPSAGKSVAMKKRKHRGIVWEPAMRKFRAKIKLKKRIWYLGLFDDEVEGAEAYDIASIFLNRKTSLNFPHQDYSSRQPMTKIPPFFLDLLLRTPSEDRSEMANQYLAQNVTDKVTSPAKRLCTRA